MATGNKDILDFTIVPDATNGSIYIVGGSPVDDYRVVVGAANGLAQLDSSGYVPGTQLNVTWTQIQSKPTTLSGFGITDGVPSSRTVTAGNGFTGGGSLAANITLTLGTPGTLGSGSTNTVTATSHTHALSLNAADIPSLDAAKIATGTLGLARLGSGTPSTTTYLRGDGTWHDIVVSGATWGGITGSMADQTDLITSLNAKAASVHTHAASAIVSGTIAPARLGTGTPDASLYLRGDGQWAGIPTVNPSWGSISGILANQTDLQSSLNGKAASVHGHSASQITSGSIDSARIAGAYSDFTSITASSTIQGNIFRAGSLGTVAAPAYSFATDSNTGIYSSAAGTINFGVNGTNEVSISGSGLACISNITAYSSDARLKTNLKNIENPIQKLFHIGGYEYDWNGPLCQQVGFQPYLPHEHGVIAQEVREVVPDAVRPAPFNDKYLTVQYDRLIPLLIEAIKELKREIEVLKRDGK